MSEVPHFSNEEQPANPEVMSESQRIQAALDIARDTAQFDGSHHKAWTIDQMVRILTGCPIETVDSIDAEGSSYTYSQLGESEVYQSFVAEYTEEDSEGYYEEWDTGIAP